MKNTLILLIILVVSCSSKKPEAELSPKAEYLKIHGSFGDQNFACEEHRQNILIKSVAGPERNPFAKNEKKALFFMNAIDFKKLGREAWQKEISFAKSNCLLMTADLPTPCNATFEGWRFFRGLVIAMKKNHWTKKTVKQGKELTNQFIRELNSGSPDFLDISIANQVLLDLAKNGFTHKSQIKEAELLQVEIDAAGKDILAQYNEAATKSDCAAFQSVFAKEKEVTAKLSEKLISNSAP